MQVEHAVEIHSGEYIQPSLHILPGVSYRTDIPVPDRPPVDETYYGIPKAQEYWVETVAVCEECADDYCSCVECAIPMRITNRGPVMDPEAPDLCEACEDANYTNCERCNDLTHNDAMHKGARDQGQELCTDCVERHMAVCDDCDDILETDYAYRVNGNGTVCPSCWDTGEYVACNYCSDLFSAGTMESDDYNDLCRDCYRNYYFRCDSCEGVFHDNNYGDNGAEECGGSGEDASWYSRNVSATVVSGTPRNDGLTFGVEVETMFDGGSPWDLGEYQSSTPAPMDFISGWKGEEDCTVDGEFISPPLLGPEGLAEIAVTFNILKANGAHMDYHAGQHTTVSTGHTCPCRVMQVTLLCEEALFAATGAFGRMTNSYATSIKQSGMSHRVHSGDGLYRHHTCANIRGQGSNLIEFRYPPGTLQPEQMVMNVGLTKLMVQIAESISEAELKKLLKDSLATEANCDMNREEKVHEHVKLGLWMIAHFGDWHRDGEMKGLLYDPDDAPTVELKDHSHDHNIEITLPGRGEILGRMTRQITSFYGKMGLAYTTALQESLEIVALDNSTIKGIVQHV
jgi:hypothetical protein